MEAYRTIPLASRRGLDRTRTQCIARIGKTRDDIVVGNARVIPEDVGFGPSVGHQADHEFDGQPRAADDRFAGDHIGASSMRGCSVIKHFVSRLDYAAGHRPTCRFG